MIKLMSYEHLESGKPLRVEFHIDREDDHWAARLRYPDSDEREVRAPVFYGATAEQAERQLRKVFDKEYELSSQEITEN